MRKEIELGNVTLVIVAPDEGEGFCGGPAWRIFIRGTPNSLDASEGFQWRSDIDYLRLRSWIRVTLCSRIANNVVDECWPVVELKLKALYDEYVAAKST